MCVVDDEYVQVFISVHRTPLRVFKGSFARDGVCLGPFCVCVVLFCVCLGLFCVCVGLFPVCVGLFRV